MFRTADQPEGTTGYGTEEPGQVSRGELEVGSELGQVAECTPAKRIIGAELVREQRVEIVGVGTEVQRQTEQAIAAAWVKPRLQETLHRRPDRVRRRVGISRGESERGRARQSLNLNPVFH